MGFAYEVKREALKRAGCRCELCRAPLRPKAFQYHHNIPRKDGGDDSLENCMVCCDVCHTSEAGFIILHGLSAPPRHFFIKGMPHFAKAKAAKLARIKAIPKIFSMAEKYGYAIKETL